MHEEFVDKIRSGSVGLGRRVMRPLFANTLSSIQKSFSYVKKTSISWCIFSFKIFRSNNCLILVSVILSWENREIRPCLDTAIGRNPPSSRSSISLTRSRLYIIPSSINWLSLIRRRATSTTYRLFFPSVRYDT